MGFWQGDGIAGKVFITLIATFCIWLLSSFVENSINGNKAYEKIQLIEPKVDTLCHRIKVLENEPKKWKEAADDLLKKNAEMYDRRTYRDSVRMFEAIKSMKERK